MSLTAEHLVIYENFLVRVVTQTEKSDTSQAVLGRAIYEVLREQLDSLKSAQAGTAEPFDTLKGVQSYILSMHDYVKWMSEAVGKFAAESKGDLALVEDAFQNKARHSLMTEYGKMVLQRTLDLSPIVSRQISFLAIRESAVKATLITAYDVLKLGASTPNWKIALEAALTSFRAYRLDFLCLTKVDGPTFVKRSKQVAEMVQEIDGRLAAIAEKVKAASATALAANEEDDEPSSSYLPDQPQVRASYDTMPDSSANDDYLSQQLTDTSSYTWEPDFNPANGLPMMGCFDIHDNVYGTNWND